MSVGSPQQRSVIKSLLRLSTFVGAREVFRRPKSSYRMSPVEQANSSGQEGWVAGERTLRLGNLGRRRVTGRPRVTGRLTRNMLLSTGAVRGQIMVKQPSRTMAAHDEAQALEPAPSQQPTNDGERSRRSSTKSHPGGRRSEPG